MGQTLPHGVYLPDEGERNCYSGLAANWQLLDSSVGTIAEHTTALAGKAPAVHTHTKSDVTDLFNSANTWTENNTYKKYIYMQNSNIEIGNTPSSNSSKEITFTDKNNTTLSRILGTVRSNGKTYIALHATNRYTNGALDPNGSSVNSYFYVGIESDGTPYNKHAAHTLPDANNTYDLGNSSFKWATINGINPGALSLPDLSESDPIDTQNWVGDNSTGNTYTPTENGWVYLRITGTNKTITIRYGGASPNSPTQTNESAITHLSVFFPVIAGVTMRIFYKDTIEQAFFYPCLGNV